MKSSNQRIEELEKELAECTVAFSKSNDILKAREGQLTAFHQIIKAMHSSMNLEEIVENLGRQVITVGFFRSLMVAIVNEKSRTVKVTCSLTNRGIDGVPLPYPRIGQRKALGTVYDLDATNITAEVARTGKMEVIAEWDERFDPNIDKPSNRSGRMSYFIPVKKEDHVLAVLATGSRINEKEEVLQRIKAIQPLLDQVAIALEQARLYNEVQEQSKALKTANEQLQKDVAERKEVETALRKFAEQQKILFDAAPDGHYLSDLKGRFVAVNKAAEEIVGYQKEELIGKEFFKLHLLTRDQLPKAAWWLAQSILGRPTGPDEFTLTRKDGSQRSVEVRTFPVKIDERKLVLGIARDITTRKQLEQQLRQAQKMEAVGQLTAGVAHNFNNMLMGIMGNLELASLTASESVKKHLAAAESYVSKAAKMVKQLMLFSHQEALTEHKSVDINNVVNDAVAICRKTFDRKIVIEAESLQEQPVIVGDFIELEQVLLNLCLNARDALESGEFSSPRIDIKVKTVYYKTAEAMVHREAQPGQYVRVLVSDNGIGMDEETQKRILEPFFTTKETNRGTGLGLATAYGIVRQHNGWIEVESKPGRGATVSIFLPENLDGKRLIDIDERNHELGGTETILVIDDEPEIRDILASMLSRNGYTVLLGVDGNNGLEVFRGEHDRIALVLLDLFMPKLSGHEVLERMVEIAPDIKVIVSTGLLDPAMRKLDVNEILSKPYREEQVLRAVRRTLDE